MRLGLRLQEGVGFDFGLRHGAGCRVWGLGGEGLWSRRAAAPCGSSTLFGMLDRWGLGCLVLGFRDRGLGLAVESSGLATAAPTRLAACLATCLATHLISLEGPSTHVSHVSCMLDCEEIDFRVAVWFFLIIIQQFNFQNRRAARGGEPRSRSLPRRRAR